MTRERLSSWKVTYNILNRNTQASSDAAAQFG